MESLDIRRNCRSMSSFRRTSSRERLLSASERSFSRNVDPKKAGDKRTFLHALRGRKLSHILNKERPEWSNFDPVQYAKDQRSKRHRLHFKLPES